MNFKNLPVVTEAASVQQITQPLFDTSGLNFMNYCVIDDNGVGYGLCTDGLYCEAYFNKQFKLSSSIGKEGKFLWHSFQNPEAIAFTRESFDYDHVFACIKIEDNRKECFIFAAPSQHRQINNFYLNHFDVLEKFMLYFKNKAAPLIATAKAAPVIMPTQMHSKINLYDYNTQALEKFIKPKKIQLRGENGLIYLTEKEIDILKLYVRGISTKQIANRIFRSQKTVEYHISSAKKKLAVSRKQDLIKIYEEQPF